MNVTPHTHRPDIYVDADGDIRIQYGDQKRHYVSHKWPGWRSRVNRVLRRQVRRHDRHSLKAGRKVNLISAVFTEFPLTESSGQWGRDIIKQKIS